MPKIGSKKFPYTAKGKKKAKTFAEKMMAGIPKEMKKKMSKKMKYA